MAPRPAPSSASLGAPPMLRAHSSPAFSSPPSTLAPGRSASPMRSPKRSRSPFAYQHEDQHPSSLVSDIESIAEDAELDITPRPTTYAPLTYGEATFHSNSLPIRRRRPASPLHHASYGALNPSAASPQLLAMKFNENFHSSSELGYAYSRSLSSSSMPSTPTSLRSRSPSISSLETIPDTPDAEAEAVEAERVDSMRRVSEGGAVEVGFGRRPGMRVVDKRKRWSVCGAETRRDLNLETIWED